MWISRPPIGVGREKNLVRYDVWYQSDRNAPGGGDFTLLAWKKQTTQFRDEQTNVEEKEEEKIIQTDEPTNKIVKLILI